MIDQSQIATAPAISERRSRCRVHCVLPVSISGTDTFGREFTVPAQTEVITRDGGMVRCAASLAAGAHVTLAFREKSAQARVAGLVRIDEDESIAYGINFLMPMAPSFWGTEFASTDAEPGVGRTMLECSCCRGWQVVELGEIEMLVLESIRTVGLYCETCRCETLWECPRQLEDGDLVTGSAAYCMETMQQKPHRRTRDERRHPRLSLKNVQACIRAAGIEDDVVSVIDLSRGGVRFASRVDYQRGVRVEVAVPYTSGGANIYVPAKIVRVAYRAHGEGMGEYACQYIPS